MPFIKNIGFGLVGCFSYFGTVWGGFLKFISVTFMLLSSKKFSLINVPALGELITMYITT